MSLFASGRIYIGLFQNKILNGNYYLRAVCVHTACSWQYNVVNYVLDNSTKWLATTKLNKAVYISDLFF